MGYGERNTWVQTIMGVVGTAVYLALLLPQLGRPVEDIDWAWPMAWTIIGVIIATIGISIGWGIVAGIRDPDEEHAADQRDREIEWFGDRVGQAFMAIGGVAGLILAMVEAPWFWIGNALYFSFFLSSTVGGTARLFAYHKAFQ